MRFAYLVGLALHELWISFRLLLVMALVLLSSLPAALFPHSTAPGVNGAPLDSLGWYAMALAAALALTAAVAAATVAAERRSGPAGWLVGRTVPRASVLLAWFAAFDVVLVIGLVPAGVVGWLSIQDALPPTGPGSYVAALAASATGGMAAIALGLAAGTVLGPIAAGIATLLLAAPPLIGGAAGMWDLTAVPGGGLHVLASLESAARPIADSLQAGGTSLGVAAIFLLVALAAFDRAAL
jgi:hypothetical protein